MFVLMQQHHMESTRRNFCMKILTLVLLLCSTYFASLSNVALADTAKNKVKQMQTTTINLNTATLDQLVTLPGIGKKKAAAIIEYRKKYGKFKSVKDLTQVKGVGLKMLDKLKGQVNVS
jgi:competence protein ComEA